MIGEGSAYQEGDWSGLSELVTSNWRLSEVARKGTIGGNSSIAL
jgi:hypothetical protein